MVSRNIPTEIKRAVRERCGFTCVMCGNLIWEYEHIIPFADCQEHSADNITLLCRSHHGEVTAGRLSKDAVRAANAQPFGKQKKFYPSYGLNLKPIECVWVCGHSIIPRGNNCHVSVVADKGIDQFSIVLRDGWPFFSIRLRDTAGQEILIVEENEILFNDDFIRDINFVGSNLKVVGLNDRVMLELQIKDSVCAVLKAVIVCEKSLVFCNTSCIRVVDSRLVPTEIYNNTAVLGVGPNEKFTVCSIDTPDDDVPRFGVLAVTTGGNVGEVPWDQILRFAN